MWDAICTIALYLMVGGVHFLAGYEHGVKETEKRWSEAIARAEDRRKYAP